ncbi:MAG TPA: NAD(P)H-hydrate dehydratase [Verrucomicrobiae bacterium]|nr:NAD(P)H-hydrate dehydratase [Verrucomicrobiae bacterium]
MKAVTTEQIRQLDERTIAAGIAGEELMERAGYAVARTTAELLKRRDARAVLLFAGKGNNGGDAIVAARHLASAGCHPSLVLLCRRGELRGDPLLHFKKLVGGVQVFELPELVGPALGSASSAAATGAAALHQIVAETEPAVIVDGLLGTGLKGEVHEPYTTVIKVINGLQRSVVAIDIPSGLDSDTGESHGACVRADATVTMGLPKIGLLRAAAADSVGRITVADIGFPRDFVDEIQTDVELLTGSDVATLLPPRRRSAHKGEFGHLLVIAGSEGYTGAPVLAAHAAARAGAGLVTLAVPQNVYPIIAANCPPEVMPRPTNFEQLGLAFFAGFDAVAIGPGLGQHPETRKLVWQVLSSCPVPMVVDADALNVVAQNVGAMKKSQKPLVLTPHPGEMARLVGKTAKEVQASRWEVARSFAQECGVVTVLKGAGTVVTDKFGKLWVNATGNPGMAKGGMGDALTGIIGAFLARKMALLDAARAAVFVHGLAGDLACSQLGESAMLTTDLIGHLGAAFAALD